MLDFKNHILEYDQNSSKETYSFTGILLADKLNFELNEEAEKQLEFFDLKVYQTCNHSLVIYGFSPFCNERFIEIVEHSADLNLHALISRIVGCMPIGEDQLLVEDLMLKVEKYVKSIFITEIINLEKLLGTIDTLNIDIRKVECHPYNFLKKEGLSCNHSGVATVNTINHKIFLNIEWILFNESHYLQITDFDIFGVIINNKDNIREIMSMLNSPVFISKLEKKLNFYLPALPHKKEGLVVDA